MRGVLCSRADTRLVDVAHDFPRQDVRTTAFWLREVLPCFPPAVHLVVVDPGVGTQRNALVVRAGEHALIGPDNGVLLPPARALAAGVRDGGDGDEYATENGVEVFTWAVDDPASHTFHGRDVFAPAAAAVHEVGVADLETLDRTSATTHYVDLTFPDPDVNGGEGEDGTADGGNATGEVLVIDGFGNAITNLPGSLLDGRFGGDVLVNGESSPVERTYAAVDPGERLVTVGSHANVELATNRGRGDDAFCLDVGDPVHLVW